MEACVQPTVSIVRNHLSNIYPYHSTHGRERTTECQSSLPIYHSARGLIGYAKDSLRRLMPITRNMEKHVGIVLIRAVTRAEHARFGDAFEGFCAVPILAS